MAKTLVTCFSVTGNTRIVAEAIHDAVGGTKEIKDIGDAGDPIAYDLVFVGFPVHSHGVPYPVEVFLKSLPEGKRIALFCTHGSFTGSRFSREGIEHAATIASKTKIVGTFACRGKVSADVLASLENSPQHESWTRMAASAATHPDEHDLAEARAFAKWAASVGSSIA